MITLGLQYNRPWEQARISLTQDLNTLTLGLNQVSSLPIVGLTYSTGTWTPVDISGAGLPFTFDYPPATWLKLGSMVYVVADVVYPSTASGANARIGGLPFPLPPNQQSLNVAYTTATMGIFALLQGNLTQTINLYQSGSGAGAPVANSSLSTLVLRLSGWYQSTA